MVSGGNVDQPSVVFIVAVCTGRRLSVRPSWYGSEIDLALEGWPRWSGFSLKILDVPPSARVLSQPTRPIPKRRADVDGSLTLRGEQKVADDSSFINHDWLPGHPSCQSKPGPGSIRFHGPVCGVSLLPRSAMTSFLKSTSMKTNVFGKGRSGVPFSLMVES